MNTTLLLGSGEEVFNPGFAVSAGAPSPTVLRRALDEVYSLATYIVETVDLGEIIGETTCVSTGLRDVVYFAQCLDPKGCLAPFVKGRKPEPSTLVTVELLREDDGSYLLLDAYIGSQREALPDDRRRMVSYESSLAFWRTHAFISGTVPIVPNSVAYESSWAPEPTLALAS